MRVVADANAFVSAALGRSPEAPSVRIINAALDGRVELVMSPALLQEIADVLSRPRVRKRLSAEDAQLFLADIAAQVVVFSDPADPPNLCRDPDDDYVVGLATVSGADAPVSREGDLLAVGAGEAGVAILTPRQLINRLG
jgi:putative PIN family toxin of toxin-antitoxin system